jgi:hypothetical protein
MASNALVSQKVVVSHYFHSLHIKGKEVMGSTSTSFLIDHWDEVYLRLVIEGQLESKVYKPILRLLLELNKFKERHFLGVGLKIFFLGFLVVLVAKEDSDLLLLHVLNQ